MNNERRKRISDVQFLLKNIKSQIDGIICDEQAAIDSMPENLQASMRVSEMEEKIEKLDEACGIIDEVIEVLDEVIY